MPVIVIKTVQNDWTLDDKHALIYISIKIFHFLYFVENL